MAKKRLPALRELNFGSTDASTEAILTKDLLLEGYYDHKHIAYDLSSGKAWFLIGPKGSGKSAAYEHLRLKWEPRSDRGVRVWNLAGWPVADVTAIQTGASKGDAATRAAWEFFINLQIFESLTSDRAAFPDETATRLKKDLERLGLIGRDDLKTRFMDWARGDYKFQLFQASGGGAVPVTDVGILQLSRYVREALTRIPTQTQHVIAIDGLDQFFLEKDDEWQSLSALVHAANAVNLHLRDKQIPVSVVTAIRADIFSVLPSTDSSKFLEHSINLNWGENFDQSGLWKMMDTKAAASYRPGFGAEQFGSVMDYFGAPISIGKYSTVPEALMSYTRLLPRDVVAMMQAVQETHPGATPLAEQEVRDAIKLYSQTYFVNEVSNTLAGLAKPSRIVTFLEAMSALPVRFFDAADLVTLLDGEFTKQEIRPLLRRLFEIGAIGMRRGEGAAAHTDFVFRRLSGGGFSPFGSFVLHDALTRAWNVPWTLATP